MNNDFEAACRLAFADPASEPGRPCAVLHLLRRGVARTLSSDLWLAAFGLAGGIDHLSRLRYGDPTPAWRFRYALAHDLRLEEDEVGAVARFWGAVGCGSQPDGAAVGFELVDHGPTGGERVNVPALHHRFEGAVASYRRDLAADSAQRAVFLRAFERYGRVTIGLARVTVPGTTPPDALVSHPPIVGPIASGTSAVS